MENSRFGVHARDPHGHRHVRISKQILQLMGSKVCGPLSFWHLSRSIIFFVASSSSSTICFLSFACHRLLNLVMPITFNVQIGFPGTMAQHVFHCRIFDWSFWPRAFNALSKRLGLFQIPTLARSPRKYGEVIAAVVHERISFSWAVLLFVLDGSAQLWRRCHSSPHFHNSSPLSSGWIPSGEAAGLSKMRDRRTLYQVVCWISFCVHGI